MYLITYENAEEIRRLFEDKFGKEVPERSTIHKWKKRLFEIGGVNDRSRSGRQSTETVGENKENVLALVRENPCTSTRLIANEVGTSQSSVVRILKEKFHPFKPLYCQLLNDGDADRRLQFAQIMNQRFHDDPAFLHKLCFSDECVIALNSEVNKHNVHYWGTENPQVWSENLGHTNLGHLLCGPASDIMVSLRLTFLDKQ